MKKYTKTQKGQAAIEYIVISAILVMSLIAITNNPDCPDKNDKTVLHCEETAIGTIEKGIKDFFKSYSYSISHSTK